MDSFIVDLTREDWDKLPPDQKLWLIYSAVCNLNSRVRCLENRRYFDRVASFLGGVLGGIVAVLSSKIRP